MAASSIDISFEELSPLAKHLHAQCFPDDLTRHSAKKLIGTFHPRKKYVTHCVNLKFYKAHGLIISKIHRGLKFRQSDFLSPFIDLCTSLRAASTTDFEKTLFKLLANSSYGKYILKCML